MIKVNKLMNKVIANLDYLEKKSNKDLDSKTANAGKNNFTKFARDVNHANGFYWCCTFILATMSYATGSVSEAIKYLNVNTASCSTLARSFAGKGKFEKPTKTVGGKVTVFKPKAGYPIFFIDNPRLYLDMKHIGWVVGCDEKYVYTVEGNTSSSSGVVANGGCVANKKYLLTDPKIGGYGVIDYAKTSTIVVPGSSIKEGNKGEEVKKLQNMLNAMGIPDENGKTLKVDGSYGAKTKGAVKMFQRLYGLSIDGSFGAKSRAQAKIIAKCF